MKLVSLIGLVSLFAAALAGCPAAYTSPDIQSGRIAASVTANNDVSLSQNVNSYNYTMEFPFTSTPQVAVATSYLEGQIGSDQLYVISALTNQAVGTSLPFTITVNFPNYYWVTIRWTFLATTRPDFELGQLNGTIQTPNQPQQISVPLFKNIQNPTVFVFLAGYTVSPNGYSTQPAPMVFSIVSKTASSNQLTVTVLSDFLGVVSLGYAVYNAPTVQSIFTVLAGQTKMTSFNVNPLNMMKQLNTFVVGVTEFSNPNKQSMSFEVTINNSFILKVNSKTGASLTVSYILVENSQSNMCGQCPSGNIYDGSGCVNTCNDNTLVQMLTNNFGICRDCNVQNFMLVDPTKSKCVCADQCYQISSTACRPCHYSCAACNGPSPNNCIACDSVIPVGTNRYLINGACVCANGFYDDVVSGSCVPCHFSCLACNGPLASNCTSCNGSISRNFVNGQCVCAAGFVDDGFNASCQCQTYLPNGTCAGQAPPIPVNCPPNSLLNGSGQCQCVTNYINSSGFCMACPNNSQKISPTQCSCANGFTNISNNCLNCPVNYIIVGNNCQCSNTSVLNNNTCVSCPANSVVMDNRCDCIAGFILVGGFCQPCPANSTKWTSTQCQCIQNYINVSGNCVPCPGGQEAVGGVCQCPGNLVLINGQCSSCPSNSAIVNGRCQCLPNYTNVSGNCRICPIGANAQCQCPSDTVLVGNNCTRCPINSVISNGKCECIGGYANRSGVCTITCQGGSNLVNGICQCPDRTVNKSGQCTACPTGATIINNDCQCPPNTYLQGTACIQCPGNTIFINGQCQCPSGQFNIKGVCGSCGINQRYDNISSTCLCQAGFVRNFDNVCATQSPSSGGGSSNPCRPPYYLVRGGCRLCTISQRVVANSCICKQSLFYDQNMECRAVRQGEVARSGFIVCASGWFNVSGVCSRCTGGTYNPSIQDCVCPNGFVKNSANNCVRSSVDCGAGTFNGRNCVCSQGANLINERCVCDPSNTTQSGQNCVCSPGFNNASGNCIRCQSNSQWNGMTCVCKSSFVFINGGCQCPTNAVQSGDNCVCMDTFINISGNCICPAGATRNNNRCVCNQGTLINNTCTTQSPNCPPNSSFNGSSCNCNQGFYNFRGTCIANPQSTSCPPNQVFTNGQCQGCPPFSNINNNTCVCLFGVYSPTQNLCQICYPPSFWNGTSCACSNPSQTYANGQCITCHSSCRTCSGPSINQCLGCQNLNFRLMNGMCVSTCNLGSYLNTASGVCQPCGANCVNCQNANLCTDCAGGFEVVGGICRDICGDGRKLVQACDDNNKVSGDGCSATCEIEPGWNCTGGGLNQKDICTRIGGDQPQKQLLFIPQNLIHTPGRIQLVFALNDLPQELIRNGNCDVCPFLLQSRLTSGNMIPSTSSSYSSPRNFIITYDFRGVEPISPFGIQIEFNRDIARQILPNYNTSQVQNYNIDPQGYPISQ